MTGSGSEPYRAPWREGAPPAFSPTRLHPAFSIADDGDPTRTGGWYVEVFALSDPDLESHSSLLACLDGADLERRDASHLDFGTNWRLSVTHYTATDFEHDPMYLARLTLTGLTPRTVFPEHQEHLARLGPDPLIWGLGVDPFATDKDDYHPVDGDAPTCTRCAVAHPYGPYVAFERDDWTALIHAPLIVRLIPRHLTDPTGRLVSTAEETA